MIIEDFKFKGLWVRTITTTKPRQYTRANGVWTGLKNRIRARGEVQLREPSYTGCSTTFLCFQDFCEWCQTQVGYADGYQLDKDLLYKGNKVYSPEYCVFLPSEINKLLVSPKKCRGELPLGVSQPKIGGSYRATFTISGKTAHIGMYSNPESAFNAYKCEKEKHIKQQANKWRDKIDPRAYEALMNYEVEITD